MQRRGSLNWGMRIEAENAKLRALYINAHTKPGTPDVKSKDLMAHGADPSGGGFATLDEVLAEMGAKKGK